MRQYVAAKTYVTAGACDSAGQLLGRAFLGKGLPVEVRREEASRQREQHVQRPCVRDTLAGGRVCKDVQPGCSAGVRESTGQEEARRGSCWVKKPVLRLLVSPGTCGKPLGAPKQVGDGNAGGCWGQGRICLCCPYLVGCQLRVGARECVFSE